MGDSTSKAARRFDSLQQEAFLNLWRTYDRLRTLEDELFRDYDLTPQQYNVLRLLRAEQPDSVPTLVLAERLVSRAPDITRMLDKLQTRGLIERQRQTDNRRTIQVRVTKAGLDLLRSLDQPLRKCHEKQLGHMTAKQLKEMIQLLHVAREPHEPDDSSWGKQRA